MTEPRDVDFTDMRIGARVRLPRGTVGECPRCGRRGLRLVFSWRPGRYEIAYWHMAVKDVPGFAPLLVDGCTIRASKKSELPKTERKRT